MRTQPTSAQPRRILRIRQVLDMTGLRRTALYEKMNANEFPKSVKLGARAVGWHEAQILSWMDGLTPSQGGRHG